MPWHIIRQDTHGTRFDVSAHDTEAAARQRVAEFEAGYPHHQAYFVKFREARSGPATCANTGLPAHCGHKDPHA